MFGIKDFIVNDIKSVISFANFLRHESSNIYYKSTKGSKVFKFIILALFGIIITHLCHHNGNSISVTTLTYILLFDLFSLLVSALSIWIEQQESQHHSGGSSTAEQRFFAYKRYEVVAVFAATMLTQISALFVIKESVERLFISETVSHAYLGIVALVVLVIHLLITCSVENRAIDKVIETSSSSWIQEHITDISEGVCHVIPSLSGLLLPRINPVNLLGGIAAFAVLSVDQLLTREIAGSSVDTLGALAISFIIIATMTPLCVLSGRVLLQTCPGPLVAQLDKAVRAAASFDGVLEIQNEHFWSLGFSHVLGSLHVRVRRDANEQLVLAHVANKLMPLVHTLTIQVFKDSWTRASTSMTFKQPRANPFTSVDLTDSANCSLSNNPIVEANQNGHSHNHSHGHGHSH